MDDLKQRDFILRVNDPTSAENRIQILTNQQARYAGYCYNECRGSDTMDCVDCPIEHETGVVRKLIEMLSVSKEEAN